MPLQAPFTDSRGSLRPLLERMTRSALLIESKKGAVRANHYHKTDWHYSYLLYGAMEYYHRPTGSGGKPEILIVKAGQMIFTPPMVDHAMKFTQDSAFLALSRNPRDQDAYESDVVRIQMVNP